MLSSLSVRNIVLIDRLDLDLQDGLNVFTGETGAGKSILLDSLSLALGMRADSSLVRHGAAEASVTACFSVGMSHPAGMLLCGHGYGFEGEIILRRVITPDGRSKAFINDQPASVGFLKTIGDSLVEIHGQFASHRLLNPATHLETLDAYGALADKVTACRRAYHQWQYKKQRRDEAERQLMQARQEEEFLRESVADLEQLAPRPDEEESLVQRRAALMNSEKIVSALNTAYALLSDDGAGVERQLSAALAQLERANVWSDGSTSELVASLNEASAVIGDAIGELERETEKWGDVSELPAIDDRLFALRDRARRHQVTIGELPALLTQMKARLASAEQGEEAIAVLRKEEEADRLAYVSCAQILSRARQEAARKLDMAVRAELPALKLGKASFETALSVVSEEEWGEAGMDRAAFLVSTNAGAPAAPIHKVASGGELARFMLALKVNLAKADQITTMVFDEVDSGVGGATAAAVGGRLARLAEEHQVLVVTHSPQVAAFGATHYTVRKGERDGGTVTEVSALTADERQQEVARMLSGEDITETARVMARELLETCSKKKRNY